MIISINSLAELPVAAKQVIDYAGKQKVFLFYGDMGAGKTTFIKELCKTVGVDDVVTSPTFSIINEYQSDSGPVYHFDFYRLKSESEALDMGYEDYLFSGHYCFIEWPEKISGLLPDEALTISLSVSADSTRTLSLKQK